MTEEGMPTEEQLREQLRQLTIDDILLQTVVTLINLGGRRLTAQDEEEKDVEQGKKGIDAARALLPMLPQDQIGPIKDALSQLQMIYVKETGGQQDAPEPPTEEAEREKARSKLWTPPGSGTP